MILGIYKCKLCNSTLYKEINIETLTDDEQKEFILNSKRGLSKVSNKFLYDYHFCNKKQINESENYGIAELIGIVKGENK